jgi:crotonobetainyl-CoA:carnitine CoA-transferase CaiB-like acyl-CoA transferase
MGCSTLPGARCGAPVQTGANAAGPWPRAGSVEGTHGGARAAGGVAGVEVSSFVGAPLGGMTLGQLGAEVIRVDPVGGGPDIGRWPVAGSAPTT